MFASHCGPLGLVGIIYPILGKYDQAVDEAKKSIELDPDFAAAYHILAVRHQNLDRLGEADSTLDRASEGKLKFPDRGGSIVLPLRWPSREILPGRKHSRTIWKGVPGSSFASRLRSNLAIACGAA